MLVILVVGFTTNNMTSFLISVDDATTATKRIFLLIREKNLMTEDDQTRLKK
jgi:hypothetical protein